MFVCNHRRYFLSILFAWLCAGVVCSVMALAQVAPAVRDLDARPLVQVVRQACKNAGSDPEKQSYHLVLAFATGQFTSNQAQRAAMHQLAIDLTRELLVPQDQVSCVAWEGSVWDWKGPLPVQGEDATSRAAYVAALLPKTAQQQTRGGHDTEQSIVDIAAHLQQQSPGELSQTVIVLLAGDERSEAGEGQKHTLGTNAPAYLAALKLLNRLPALHLSYSAANFPVSADASDTHRIDAVLLVPTLLRGQPLPNLRSALLKQPEKAVSPPNWPARILALLILIVLVGAGAVLARRPKSPARSGGGIVPEAKTRVGGAKTLRIGKDRRLSLDGVQEGQQWRLVGPEFAGAGAEDIVVGSVIESVPPVMLARIVLRQKQFVLVTEGAVVAVGRDSKRNIIEGRELPLQLGEQTITLRGQHAPDPAMPPTKFQTAVEISLEASSASK
jgi:hypothetical protein